MTLQAVGVSPSVQTAALKASQPAEMASIPSFGSLGRDKRRDFSSVPASGGGIFFKRFGADGSRQVLDQRGRLLDQGRWPQQTLSADEIRTLNLQ